MIIAYRVCRLLCCAGAGFLCFVEADAIASSVYFAAGLWLAFKDTEGSIAE